MRSAADLATIALGIALALVVGHAAATSTAETPNYRAEMRVASPGTIEVTLVGLNGHVPDTNFASAFRLGAPPTGVSYTERVLRADTTPAGLRFILRYSASVPHYTISGTLSSSVCQATNCETVRVPLDVTVGAP